MTEYVFNKHIEKIGAMHELLTYKFSFYDYLNYGSDVLVVVSKKVLSEQELADLTLLVTNYIDPNPWLSLNSTENQLMSTELYNSATPIVLQTFIMSPSINNIVSDSIKLVVEYTTDLANVNNINSDVLVTFELYDITRNVSITTVTDNLTNLITEWKNGDSNPKWKTTQFYGLFPKITGYDCIWQLKGSINDPRVSFKINCLQKILYDQYW